MVEEKETSSKYNLISKNFKIINKTYVCHVNYAIGSGTFGKVLYANDLTNSNGGSLKVPL